MCVCADVVIIIYFLYLLIFTFFKFFFLKNFFKGKTNFFLHIIFFYNFFCYLYIFFYDIVHRGLGLAPKPLLALTFQTTVGKESAH